MSRFAPFIWVLFVVFTSATLAAEPVRKPFGIEQRELWTTGNIHGTPEPPDPYRIENAFPRLKLFEPLAVDVAPRTKRFGVATRPGKIYTFEIRPDVEEAELLVDVGRTVYGLAFHPRFQENGYFYVTSLVDPNTEAASHVFRFPKEARSRPIPPPRRSSSNGPPAGTTAAAFASGPTAIFTSRPATAAGLPIGWRQGRKSMTCWGPFCGSTWITPIESCRTRSPKTIHSWAAKTPGGKSGRSATARFGSSLSIRPPAACGRAKSGKTCGR
jgi:hypothetical protein